MAATLQDRLRQLSAATKTILAAAKEDTGELTKGWVVNWGDLHAFSEYYLDEDGYDGYRVTISEASPDNYKCAAYVYEELKKQGYDAEVLTEW